MFFKYIMGCFRNVIYIMTGILMYVAWPMSPFTVVVFFAWVPLLIVEKRITNNYIFFGILWTNLFCWNAATCWWVGKASPEGAIAAMLSNSLLMCLPWLGYRFTRIRLGGNVALVALIAYWLSIEFLSYNWSFGLPWLTLGNVFSTRPEWILWYKYTGTAGGSLWVLLVNILSFLFYKSYLKCKAKKSVTLVKSGLMTFSALASPLIISFYISIGKTGLVNFKGNNENVVVVQPNIDPYEEKYSFGIDTTSSILISLSESQIDQDTRLVIWPETAIPTEVSEENLPANKSYEPVFAFLKRHPQIYLITGINSYRVLRAIDPNSTTVRFNTETKAYYEAYNTALGSGSDLTFQFYHKSKLVPGVESMTSWLDFMGKTFDGLGCPGGTLGHSSTTKLMSPTKSHYVAAPIICYESIYGGYVTGFVNKGANILAILTNDGWWGNTPGHRQHASIARLRAIETGCWVARSANTGISCFISPVGKIFQPQPWGKQTAIKMHIPKVNDKTFYVSHGDMIGPISLIPTFILFSFALIKRNRYLGKIFKFNKPRDH